MYEDLFKKWKSVVDYIDYLAEGSDWPQPQTPEQYLGWMEDELSVQEDALEYLSKRESSVQELDDVLVRVGMLEEAINEFKVRGVEPTLPPWDVKGGSDES